MTNAPSGIGHRVPRAARRPSCKDPWPGATPSGRVAWACTCRTFPKPCEACLDGGRSRPPRIIPERRSLCRGRAATARQPARCGSTGPHMETAFRCTCTPLSNVHSGTGMRGRFPIGTPPWVSRTVCQVVPQWNSPWSLRHQLVSPPLGKRVQGQLALGRDPSR